MSRIYSENVEIDMEKAQQFFEHRFSEENPQASVMLRSSADNVAEKRDKNEAKRIEELINFDFYRTILDIGCGYGRLAMHFKEKNIKYDGIDSSKTYIQAAKNIFHEHENINFYVMLADKLDKTVLSKNYNTVFLTGLFVYMNDKAVKDVLKNLKHFTEEKALFYIRESVSVIEERLTLKDFHSEELQAEYNAIYRTPKEYEALFKNCLPQAEIVSSKLILDETTGARKETNQMYWLLQL